MDNFLQSLIILAIALVIIVGSILYVRGFIHFRRYNFDWYRKQFPELVTRDDVRCYKCGNANIGTERKLQHTYMRSHICRRCGTTLYYSQEQ